MEIEFNLGLADVEAYNTYQCNNSPALKKYLRNYSILCLFLGVIAFGIVIWGIWWTHSLSVWVFIPMGIPVLLILNISTRKRRLIKRIIKESHDHYSTHNNELGKQKLFISSESIKRSNGSGEFSVKWNFFDDTVINESHVFLINDVDCTANTDVIIPKSAFFDDYSFNQFYKTVKQYHQEALAKQ